MTLNGIILLPCSLSFFLPLGTFFLFAPFFHVLVFSFPPRLALLAFASLCFSLRLPVDLCTQMFQKKSMYQYMSINENSFLTYGHNLSIEPSTIHHNRIFYFQVSIARHFNFITINQCYRVFLPNTPISMPLQIVILINNSMCYINLTGNSFNILRSIIMHV